MPIVYGKTKKNEAYFTCGKCLEDYTEMLTSLVNSKEYEGKKIKILDPCAGGKALDIDLPNVEYDLYDICPLSDDIKQADFLEHDFGDEHYDIVVCNPPFSMKCEFFKKCCELGDYVIFISTMLKGKFTDIKHDLLYTFDFNVFPSIFIYVYNSKNVFKNTKLNPDYRSLDGLMKEDYYDDIKDVKNAMVILNGHGRKLVIHKIEPKHKYYRTSVKLHKKGDLRKIRYYQTKDVDKAIKFLEELDTKEIFPRVFSRFALSDRAYEEFKKLLVD